MNLIGVVVPFLGLIAAVVLLWNQWVDWIDLTIMAVTYLMFGLGITVGYHRLLTHRSFRTHKPTEYTFAILGSMGAPGLGDGLGGRPPQAPRARRRGGRPALPARRPRLRPRRALARPHRLADGDPRPGRLEEVRRRALRGPGHAPHRPHVPVAGARLASAIPTLARLGAARLHARGRAARPRVGRPGARVLPAPRHLVDQLDLPLLRQPPVRDRGQVDQRGLARDPVDGRGVAPQPPRLPALGRARAEALGGRPVGAADPRDGEGRAGVERRADRARAPGRPSWSARSSRRRHRRPPSASPRASASFDRPAAHAAGRLALGALAAHRRQPAQDQLEVGDREPADLQERLAHAAGAVR